MKELALERVRELTLETSAPGAPRYLAAASGMVAAGDRLFVIADDDLHLGVFPAQGTAPGRAVRLLPGRLPDGKEARKLLKPDFEVLVQLPAFEGYEGGALLALGSGSTPRRARGALASLAGGELSSELTEGVDFTPIYAALEQTLPELNIEGAVVVGDRLLLLHRGNGARGQNALVTLKLQPLLQSLGEGTQLSATSLHSVTQVELGDLGGVPLGFTDGLLLPDGRVLYSAVAEATASTYADGPCVGAVLGVLGTGGEPQEQRPLAGCVKVEGICLAPGKPGGLLLVADADEASRPAVLYRADWEG